MSNDNIPEIERWLHTPEMDKQIEDGLALLKAKPAEDNLAALEEAIFGANSENFLALDSPSGLATTKSDIQLTDVDNRPILAPAIARLEQPLWTAINMLERDNQPARSEIAAELRRCLGEVKELLES